MLRPLALALLLGATATPLHADDGWDGRTAAFFGVTFIDSSAEGEISGPRSDEAERVARMEQTIGDALVAHGVVLVDLGPVAGELETVSNPSRCYGCDQRMASKLGVDLIVVSEVQKVSNLLLSMNVEVRDPTSGALLRGRAVEVRGNTDETWQRSVDYLLEHGIFRD